MASNTNSRRHFLRNTALASLSAGILPGIVNAKESKTTEACNPTTLDYYGQGPFYTAGAPAIANNLLASVNESGTRLILSGVVRTLDCTQMIPNTLVDAWHANNAGAYDSVGYNLRGITYSNAQGFYYFETILPGKYLNGASYRPSHIHFKITPPGFPTLTTQLYFEGDTDIPGDAAASLTSGTYNATDRIIPIALNNDGKYEGTWDIIVNGNGIATVMADIHLENGMIYTISPNPFRDKIEIYYGVFKPAKVSIRIFNMNGAQVAILDEQQLTPEKYNATWYPDSSLVPGVYFITLSVNDLQVHYQRVVKL